MWKIYFIEQLSVNLAIQPLVWHVVNPAMPSRWPEASLSAFVSCTAGTVKPFIEFWELQTPFTFALSLHLKYKYQWFFRRFLFQKNYFYYKNISFARLVDEVTSMLKAIWCWFPLCWNKACWLKHHNHTSGSKLYAQVQSHSIRIWQRNM